MPLPFASIVISVHHSNQMIPTPLKTILSPVDYPFAVAAVVKGKISHTFGYSKGLADCYAKCQGWRSSCPDADIIMVEQREIGAKRPNCVNSYWVAV